MPDRLVGKVALVTGASSGIGRATAILFAQEGAMVVTAARRVREGEETVAMIKARGGTGLFVQTDITRASEVEALVGATVRTYGRLDCAFNNAGAVGGQRVRTGDFAEETFDQIMATNVKGTWLSMKYELQQMLRQERGAIVNCASVMGLRGLPAPGRLCHEQACDCWYDQNSRAGVRDRRCARECGMSRLRAHRGEPLLEDGPSSTCGTRQGTPSHGPVGNARGGCRDRPVAVLGRSLLRHRSSSAG